MRDWHMDSGKDLFRKNLLESIPKRGAAVLDIEKLFFCEKKRKIPSCLSRLLSIHIINL